MICVTMKKHPGKQRFYAMQRANSEVVACTDIEMAVTGSRQGSPAMNRRKTGRPRIEDRAKTIEARKPWLKLEMSRRTWYRRQAEKRQGRE
jgi:hypothetical protein